MWFTLKIFGVVILDLTIGLADRPEPAEEFVSNTGGQFEVAGETDAEWEPSEDWEYEEDAGKLIRRPPFGFRYA